MKYYIFTFIICYSLTGFSQILFSEESASQNINVSHGVNEFVGGMSFFDFDNDGWDDLTFASEDGLPIYFFKNNSGTFNSISLNLTDHQDDTRQITWVDIDNDGDNDLFVVSHNAQNRLYLNDGNMNFTDITLQSGISTIVMRSWGASWGDYNNDGYLDLFLSNYDLPLAVYPNLLYRNNGDNTFTDVSVSAGISTSNHYSFCSAFFDYNNDGWQDIYIVNDRFTTSNILYENNGDGTFTDVSVASGTGIYMDAMSTTIEDYNYDGYLDIYITNTASGNYFMQNNGNGTFTNIAASTGTLFNSVAWGAVFIDADNDTKQDLYVSGMRDGSLGFLPSAFYENNGNGTFSIPTGAGFASDTAESYSNAIGDVNNDGFPDMSVLNVEPTDNFLWINECHTNQDPDNNWLKVTLEGTTSNRMGIGSWIEVSAGGITQNRYKLLGEGYISQNSGAEFFGLKENTNIDFVKVTWLSGVEDILYNVSSNQTLHIVESSTLGVPDNELNTFKIYPNPTNGIFQIKFDSQNINPTKILVKTILGELILVETITSTESTIDLSSYSKGIYFITIEEENSLITKKIIIK